MKQHTDTGVNEYSRVNTSTETRFYCHIFCQFFARSVNLKYWLTSEVLKNTCVTHYSRWVVTIIFDILLLIKSSYRSSIQVTKTDHDGISIATANLQQSTERIMNIEKTSIACDACPRSLCCSRPSGFGQWDDSRSQTCRLGNSVCQPIGSLSSADEYGVNAVLQGDKATRNLTQKVSKLYVNYILT